MSVIALLGGIIFIGRCKRIWQPAPTARPSCGGSRVSGSSRTSSSLFRGNGRGRLNACSARGTCSRNFGCSSASLCSPPYGLSIAGLEPGPIPETPFDPPFMLVWIVGGICAVGAAFRPSIHRLASLALSGAGMVTCVTFVWLSAPDLALTQLLVEIVTTVLILLGLRWLPKRFWKPATGDVAARCKASACSRSRLSIAAGTGMSLVAYAVMTRPMPDTISRFFIENAYSGGGGRTSSTSSWWTSARSIRSGEIVVLAIVAITVYSLLRRFRPAPESVDEPEQQQIQNAYDEARPERERAIPSRTISSFRQ